MCARCQIRRAQRSRIDGHVRTRADNANGGHQKTGHVCGRDYGQVRSNLGGLRQDSVARWAKEKMYSTGRSQDHGTAPYKATVADWALWRRPLGPKMTPLVQTLISAAPHPKLSHVSMRMQGNERFHQEHFQPLLTMISGPEARAKLEGKENSTNRLLVHATGCCQHRISSHFRRWRDVTPPWALTGRYAIGRFEWTSLVSPINTKAHIRITQTHLIETETCQLALKFYAQKTGDT